MADDFLFYILLAHIVICIIWPVEYLFGWTVTIAGVGIFKLGRYFFNKIKQRYFL